MEGYIYTGGYMYIPATHAPSAVHAHLSVHPLDAPSDPQLSRRSGELLSDGVTIRRTSTSITRLRIGSVSGYALYDRRRAESSLYGRRRTAN